MEDVGMVGPVTLMCEVYIVRAMISVWLGLYAEQTFVPPKYNIMHKYEVYHHVADLSYRTYFGALSAYVITYLHIRNA